MIKRFLVWIKEEFGIKSGYENPSNPHHDLWKHGLPALRHKFTGHMVIGKRGDAHEDMMAAHGEGHERGIYHKKEKKFYKSGKDTVLDSTDLMTARQRMNRDSAW